MPRGTCVCAECGGGEGDRIVRRRSGGWEKAPTVETRDEETKSEGGSGMEAGEDEDDGGGWRMKARITTLVWGEEERKQVAEWRKEA